MFLKLLEKFEKEVLGGKITANRHDAREDFALWLDKQERLTKRAPDLGQAVANDDNPGDAQSG